MAGWAEKHHARKVGLVEAGGATLTGGGRTQGAASIYREVVQSIILYGSETWVLLMSMANRVEGGHTEFLQLITGKRARRLGDGAWETLGLEDVR